jgi:hypothetical protein
MIFGYAPPEHITIRLCRIGDSSIHTMGPRIFTDRIQVCLGDPTAGRISTALAGAGAAPSDDLIAEGGVWQWLMQPMSQLCRQPLLR